MAALVNLRMVGMFSSLLWSHTDSIIILSSIVIALYLNFSGF